MLEPSPIPRSPGVLHRVLELLWPRACAGCDALGAPRLCETCTAEIRVRPFSAGHEAGVPVEGHALVGYDSGIGRALLRAKMGADRGLMQLLGGVLAEAAGALGAEADAIVPAPSPWDRRARRGFAPASILAEALAAASGVPVIHALAVARGARQVGLDATGRKGNLRGRLRSVRPAPGHVLLVDDVVTTGTTLGMCASELLGDQTGRVTAVALCAAELSRPGVRRPPTVMSVVDR